MTSNKIRLLVLLCALLFELPLLNAKIAPPNYVGRRRRRLKGSPAVDIDQKGTRGKGGIAKKAGDSSVPTDLDVEMGNNSSGHESVPTVGESSLPTEPLGASGTGNSGAASRKKMKRGKQKSRGMMAKLQKPPGKDTQLDIQETSFDEPLAPPTYLPTVAPSVQQSQQSEIGASTMASSSAEAPKGNVETGSPMIETAPPTLAPTQSATLLLASSPTETPEALLATSAPTVMPTAPVLNEQVANATDVPASTVSPGSAPTASQTASTTASPTAQTCPRNVTIDDTWTFNFIFADREPRQTEIDALEEATLQFYIDTLRQKYGEDVTTITGGIESTSFEFGPPPVFTMGIGAHVPFVTCAPPLEELTTLFTLDDAQYETYLTNYVFPMEPVGEDGAHIFVLTAKVARDGSISYAEQ